MSRKVKQLSQSVKRTGGFCCIAQPSRQRRLLRARFHSSLCLSDRFIFSMSRRSSSCEFITLHALGKACGIHQELPMPVSDILLQCSVECARLARQCRDEKTAVALFEVSARLLAAATRDAELITDEPQHAAEGAPHAGAPLRSIAVAGRK
jgi:hypothetical protein